MEPNIQQMMNRYQKSVAGRSPATDEEGFLLDPSEWDMSIAE